MRSKSAIDRLIARRDVHLREKTLWRMLYETWARSEEILDVNVEDLDLVSRRCPVKAKGSQPKVRRRGGARDENVRRCFKPSPEAIAEVTGLLAPGNSRRSILLSPVPES